jgi:hypothetical protein
MIKQYYLHQAKAITAGVFLVFIGLCPIFITMMTDEHHSVIAGLQTYVQMFTGFPQLILGLICLAILTAGVLYLKNSGKIVRAQLDDEGFHYFPIGESTPSKGSLLFSLFYYKTKLKFIPYTQIAGAELLRSKWQGNGIILRLRNGGVKQLFGAVVPTSHQQEVVDIINSKVTPQ